MAWHGTVAAVAGGHSHALVTRAHKAAVPWGAGTLADCKRSRRLGPHARALQGRHSSGARARALQGHPFTHTVVSSRSHRSLSAPPAWPRGVCAHGSLAAAYVPTAGTNTHTHTYVQHHRRPLPYERARTQPTAQAQQEPSTPSP
jgi:hypothetical protein